MTVLSSRVLAMSQVMLIRFTTKQIESLGSSDVIFISFDSLLFGDKFMVI